MRVFVLDEGVLMKKDGNSRCYSNVYDNKYAYFDEAVQLSKDKDSLIQQAKKYVEDGCENTYAVVSGIVVEDGFDLDKYDVSLIDYSVDDVVYSVAKLNGQVKEGFIS